MTVRALPLLLALAVAGAAPPPAKTPTPKTVPRPRGAPRVDFSGVWQLDPAASRNAPSNMADAVLAVTQTGNRIRVEPIEQKHILVLADEIVADGRTYEKGVGNKLKGLVTAIWAPDGQSLRMQVLIGPPEKPTGEQRTIWTLSKDRSVWVRETLVRREGESPTATRLVFRRRKK